MSCDCGAKKVYNAKPGDSNHYLWCSDSKANLGKPRPAASTGAGIGGLASLVQAMGGSTAAPVGAAGIVRPPPFNFKTPTSALGQQRCYRCASINLAFVSFDNGGWWYASCNACYPYLNQGKMMNWVEVAGSPGKWAINPANGVWGSCNGPLPAGTLVCQNHPIVKADFSLKYNSGFSAGTTKYFCNKCLNPQAAASRVAQGDIVTPLP